MKLNEELRRTVRENAGHDEEPRAGKKVKGRKRHLLVDTLGLLLVSWMTTGDVQDRDATPAVLPLAAQQYPTLKKAWVDGGYAGPKVQAVALESRIDVEVVKRSDQAKGLSPSQAVLDAFQPAPILPRTEGNIVPGTEREPGPITCPCVVKLWDAPGKRVVILGGVVFPDSPKPKR